MKIPRLAWNIAGAVLLVIGILGVLLPLLPGTVFLLGASACFVRGSERAYRWLHEHPLLGRYLQAVRNGAPMPMKAVVISLAAMWISVVYSVTQIEILLVEIMLVMLALIGTAFILRLRFRTARRG